MNTNRINLHEAPQLTIVHVIGQSSRLIDRRYVLDGYESNGSITVDKRRTQKVRINAVV
jgi:hypothetical protein